MSGRKFIKDDIPSVMHFMYNKNGLSMTEILKYFKSNYEGLLTNLQLRIAVARALNDGMKNGVIVLRNRRYFMADVDDSLSPKTLQTRSRQALDDSFTDLKDGCRKRRRQSSCKKKRRRSSSKRQRRGGCKSKSKRRQRRSKRRNSCRKRKSKKRQSSCRKRRRSSSARRKRGSSCGGRKRGMDFENHDYDRGNSPDPSVRSKASEKNKKVDGAVRGRSQTRELENHSDQ